MPPKVDLLPFPAPEAAILLLLRAWPLCFNHGGDTAAWTEIAGHVRPYRIAGLHHILQNLVHHIFLKYSKIPVAEQILLPRFQFQTALARHITQLNDSEIGQSGLGAHRSKFGIIDQNLISRELVWPGFNGRKLEVEPRFGV